MSQLSFEMLELLTLVLAQGLCDGRAVVCG